MHNDRVFLLLFIFLSELIFICKHFFFFLPQRRKEETKKQAQAAAELDQAMAAVDSGAQVSLSCASF